METVTSEPTGGFSSATLGADTSITPDEASAAARSQQAGGSESVRLCDDCGRDTYSLTRRRCVPCERDNDRRDADDVDGVRW